MAKRRKKTDWRYEIGYRIAMLAGIGGFLYGIFGFENTNSTTQLLLAGALGGGAMVATAGVFSLIFRPKPQLEATFDFDTPPVSKHQAATDFEYEVAGIIHQLTGKRTEVVGGSGDGGIDIKVYDDEGRLTGIVQCKNLAPNKHVYPAYIRDLNTVRHYHHVNTAYLVSTGRFSDKSRDLAKRLGIRLIDGDALQKLRAKAISTASQL